MDWSNYYIKQIDKTTCGDFLLKHHYLSKQGFSFRSGYNFGLYFRDKLIGVVVFHTVSAWETVKGCFKLPDRQQAGFWELGRLAMDGEHAAKNCTSWFVARCIKLLRKATTVRALLSYADSLYHHGYIYQATNFGYYGLTAEKSDFWVKQADGSFKKQSRGKTKGVDGEWRKRSRKHRYLIVYDDSLTVYWKKEPYPKGDNTEY